MFDLMKQIGAARANAETTAAEFDPRWMMGVAFAQMKKLILQYLERDPKLPQLAARLGVDEQSAGRLWNAFLLHLKEDY